MRKILFLFAATCALAACQTRPAPVPECPSCDPPVQHFEVVTKCTNYKNKDLGNGTYSQCRYCTNRIYSNGIDVTDSFRKEKKTTTNANVEKNPCIKI